MPREIVSVHVGQCGLQMGMSFWQAALAEHERYNAEHRQLQPQSPASLPSASPWSQWSAAEDAMSTFFSSSASSSASASAYRARAVLVDMESGVLDAIARHPVLAPLFPSPSSCSVRDVSGAGNNFAQGALCYGPQYRAAIADCVRLQVEDCDSLQSFFLSHSTGGGTGSGLGAAILDALRDDYPDVYVVEQCVLPSHTDDVVTSPYNAALSLEAITQRADVVLPFDNAALTALVSAAPTTSAQQQRQQQLQRGTGVQRQDGTSSSAGGPLGSADRDRRGSAGRRLRSAECAVCGGAVLADVRDALPRGTQRRLQRPHAEHVPLPNHQHPPPGHGAPAARRRSQRAVLFHAGGRSTGARRLSAWAERCP